MPPLIVSVPPAPSTLLLPASALIVFEGLPSSLSLNLLLPFVRFIIGMMRPTYLLVQVSSR